MSLGPKPRTVLVISGFMFAQCVDSSLSLVAAIPAIWLFMKGMQSAMITTYRARCLSSKSPLAQESREGARAPALLYSI